MGDELLPRVADKLYTRWGMTARPTITCRDEMGKLLAISIGLGSIFNEDEKAERTWINSHNTGLRAEPRRLILQGRYDEVLAAVNRARNL